jgi:thiamine kinase-like enzyme
MIGNSSILNPINIIELPDTALLSQYLFELLSANGISNRNIRILSREKFINASTFPAEVIICEIEGNCRLPLFCKYLSGKGQNNFGHRGGVEYEIKVYDQVLRHIPLSKPKYYGTCYLKESNETLLVIQFLENSCRLNKSSDPELYVTMAAGWIASFHNFWAMQQPSFIKPYDNGYYSYWVDQVRKLLSNTSGSFNLLVHLCDYFTDNLNILTQGQLTLIHGEYYPANILIKNDSIYPIDWESVAIATPEIDLASLIEGWSDSTVEKFINAYTTARWPDGNFPRKEFADRLLMARIYFHLRWIGDDEKVDIEMWMKDPKILPQLTQLTEQIHCS